MLARVQCMGSHWPCAISLDSRSQAASKRCLCLAPHRPGYCQAAIAAARAAARLHHLAGRAGPAPRPALGAKTNKTASLSCKGCRLFACGRGPLCSKLPRHSEGGVFEARASPCSRPVDITRDRECVIRRESIGLQGRICKGGCRFYRGGAYSDHNMIHGGRVLRRPRR